MRKALLLLSVIGMASCDFRPETPREQFLFRVFDSMNVAVAYGKVCAGRERTTAEQSTFFGNLQVAVNAIGAEMAVTRPDMTAQELKDMLDRRGLEIERKAASALQSAGCESEQAAEAGKAYRGFLTTVPQSTKTFIEAGLASGGDIGVPRFGPPPTLKESQ